MAKKKRFRANVLRAIEHAQKTNSTSLDLSYRYDGEHLNAIPEQVFRLLQLTDLNLSGNNIRRVPERIRALSNLKTLDLWRNPISEVPDVPGLHLDWDAYLRCRKALSKQSIEGLSIEGDDNGDLEAVSGLQVSEELASLPRLRRLSIEIPRSIISGSPLAPSEWLTEVLANVGKLQALDELRVYEIPVESIPSSICKLTKLHTLYIIHAGLTEVPEWIVELTSLRILGLWSNRLTTIPNSFTNLASLEQINLDDNQFDHIPNVLFELKELTMISFAVYDWLSEHEFGSIRQIPADILKSPKLRSLDVDGQPIETPPPEIVNDGVEAIKNYWRQQQEAGIDYLCEAKLIILGEAGAGKTTLAQKIKDPAYRLSPDLPSTEGIDVLHWSFPSLLRLKQAGLEGKEQVLNFDFKVNIWDFGGQEIYHATHQFFLTRRSLYVLVTDDRKEDTDFNYWLQAVELLSDGSPVLIVQNEKQGRQRDIDLGTLRARFPNLKESFPINLRTNRDLDRLTAAIRGELERLPHIGTPLPKTWARVRHALESDARNFITLDEYFKICDEHGFERREDKLQLSGYLHDLGIFLHFQEDEVLKHVVILKPKWGTDAVYRVLDDRTVVANRGRFGAADLERIWSDAAYSTMWHELLRLMMKFQLCYQLPNAEEYIAPQLLSPTRPEYEWPSRSLVLRYEYDFMPKGLLTRFIVALNHLIRDQDRVWKSGVVLARAGASAEVIEDYPRRRITVRTAGGDSPGILAIVDDCLEQIHKTFPRLQYDKFLPCNCAVCLTRDEPFAYPLSELVDFARQGDKIQCRTSRKLVDAASLIWEVLPTAGYATELFARQADSFARETAGRAGPPIEKEVFVSYAWNDESKAIVDKLQTALVGSDIKLVRDQNEVQYRESIRHFMKRIGRGKAVVVILSKQYLESQNCMFEMTEIANEGQISDRVFPIVLPDSNIYKAIDRLGYIEYWEQKQAALNAKLKKVRGENLHGIREELDLYAKIRNTIAGIVDTLSDMNALTPERHNDTNFDHLLRMLRARLVD